MNTYADRHTPIWEGHCVEFKYDNAVQQGKVTYSSGDGVGIMIAGKGSVLVAPTQVIRRLPDESA